MCILALVILQESAFAIYIVISHKHHNFQQKIVENKMRVLIFSTTLSGTFLILRRIRPDIIIKVHRSSCKVLVILAKY